MSNPNILIADDDPDIVANVRDIFAKNGYHTFCAFNGIDAWNELVRQTADVAACVIDLQMPPGTFGGKDLVATIRRSFSKRIPLVIYSGRGTISLSHEVTKAGADAFVEKEAGTQALLDIVARLISETPRSLTPVQSSLNELARCADLPSLALKSFRTLEHIVRKRILSHYTPQTLRDLLATKGPAPSVQLIQKLNEITDFADEKKLTLGDILDVLAALSARQLHKLPPAAGLRQLNTSIVPARNSLFHGREVDTRTLVVAITSTEDLLDKLGRDR